MTVRTLIVAVSLLLPFQVGAEDIVDIKEGSTIRGATELPKVLYIVPWKKGGLDDVIMQPGSSVFGEDLAPIDRDVFQRQVQFHQLLQTRDLAQGR